MASDFPAMVGMVDGLSSWCRPCHRAAALDHHRRTYIPHPRQPVHGPPKPRVRRDAYRASMIGKSCQLVWLKCQECGVSFTRKRRSDVDARFCSNRCRSMGKVFPSHVKRARPQVSLACMECGVTFTGTPGRRFCTPAHATRFCATEARHRRRAAKYGKGVERISDQAVFVRDGWLCGICGLLIDRELPRTSQIGATIDHIIPLSRGGAHKLSNLQAAHRTCNQRKGARVAA